MDKTRKHYIFSGYVQGVGFRYRSYYAAKKYSVTGWVKNISCGDVEMEAEGLPSDIERMLAEIYANRYTQIDKVISKTIPVENDRSFKIID